MNEQGKDDVIIFYPSLDARRSRWEYQVWLNGKQVQRNVGGKTKEEAIAAALKWIAESDHRFKERRMI